MGRVSIEAGGNAPFIVFDDANIDDAVAGESPFWIIVSVFPNHAYIFKRPLSANSAVQAKPVFARTEFMCNRRSMPNLRHV